jgi:cellobiose-specific phosphotransferase system component IIC
MLEIGLVTVPVNVGEAVTARVALLGIVVPLILVAVATPRLGVVNVGETKFAFKSKAVCCAVETGLLASEVSVTFPRPTWVAVTPETVPVKVGDAIGALVATVAVSVAVLASR